MLSPCKCGNEGDVLGSVRGWSINWNEDATVHANTYIKQYFWMTQLDHCRESYLLKQMTFQKNQIKMGLINTLTSLARTWEYSMSNSYRVSMWSLVNAIGTKRMFFLPLLQSPLMASSVWGPSQGMGPTYEKAGGVHTGTVSHHSPLHRTHSHVHTHIYTEPPCKGEGHALHLTYAFGISLLGLLKPSRSWQNIKNFCDFNWK